MNTNLKQTAVLRALFVATAMFAIPATAYAGGKTHVMPAATGQAQQVYDLQIVSAPGANTPLAVRLVNTKDGQFTTDADVVALTPMHMGPKPSPSEYFTTPLRPNGQDDFVYSGRRLVPGTFVKLYARIHATGDVVRQTVKVGG